MNKLFAAVLLGLVTGCRMMDIADVTTTTTTIVKNSPVTVTEHRVEFGTWSLLMNSAMDQASLDYGPVKLKIGGYTSTGDTATANTITDGIVGGITAYFTAGASAVGKGVIKGMAASEAAEAKPATVAPKAESLCPGCKPE